MLRKISALTGSLLVIVAVAATTAVAGVPKVVVGEDFTAQWCTYCPYALCALEQVRDEFGGTFIFMEDHCTTNDPFTTPETTAREHWYGVTGYPTVQIDGKYQVVGAGGCASAATQYRARINQRLAETGGISPVEITGAYLPTESDVEMQATFRLLDPASLSNLRATLVILEDNIYWCCGFGGQSIWNDTVRKIYDQNVTLTNVGDEVTVSTSIPLDPSWNADNLKVIAYLQTTTGTREIIQGAMLPLQLDFSLVFSDRVRSVPNGNGTATFNARLTNISQNTDTITLQPGSSFGTWTDDFLVCGDPNAHTSAVQMTLAPNETCDLQLRVQTDDAKEIRSGSFLATSSVSGRTQTTSLRVFNKSYSVIVVDNDGNKQDETKILNGLGDLGYLYDDYDVYNDHNNMTPTYQDIAGYDVLIWQTGLSTSTAPNATDMDHLMAYMDNGGALFLTSQLFLNTLNGQGNTFTSDYLGIDSWTTDRGYTTLTGVAGDAIGDGITVPLSYQFPSFNKSDDAVPGPTASTDFFGEDGSHATIRNETRGARSVFMPTDFSVISDTDPDPNNTRVILGRILDWLRPLTADAGDASGSILASRIDAVRPNPFNPKTQIVFSISPNGANHPARLEVFDLAGRRVAALAEGRLSPGTHVSEWTGLTDAGRPVESGIYFARLTTVEGTQSGKLVLLK